MGEIYKLRVKSPYELMKIVDIRMENKPNTHGYLYLKCLIDEKVNFNATIKASISENPNFIFGNLNLLSERM